MRPEILGERENFRVQEKERLLQPKFFVQRVLEGMPFHTDYRMLRTALIARSVVTCGGTMTEGELKMLANRIKDGSVKSKELEASYVLEGIERDATAQDIKEILASVNEVISIRQVDFSKTPMVSDL